MEEIQNKKLIMRIGRSSLSFTIPDPADKERPLRFEPYVVKGGISMAANLREALKTATLPSADFRRVQVVLDTPSMLVPIEQFEEDAMNDLYAYTFASSQEPRRMLFKVDRFGNDPVAMRQAGIIYATEQIIDLIANGITHIHVYSMNKPDVASDILYNLKGIID